MRQVFRQEEAEQVLKEAVRRDTEQRAALTGAHPTAAPSVSEERLREMADELGVSSQVLEAVLQERAHEQSTARRAAADQELRREFITERRGGFLPHLYAYVGVNALLVFINLLTRGTMSPYIPFAVIWWSIWPLILWGLGLYLHAVHSLPTRGAMFERSLTSWKAVRLRREEREAQRKEKEARRLAREAEKTARARAEAELSEL